MFSFLASGAQVLSAHIICTFIYSCSSVSLQHELSLPPSFIAHLFQRPPHWILVQFCLQACNLFHWPRSASPKTPPIPIAGRIEGRNYNSNWFILTFCKHLKAHILNRAEATIAPEPSFGPPVGPWSASFINRPSQKCTCFANIHRGFAKTGHFSLKIIAMFLVMAKANWIFAEFVIPSGSFSQNNG